MCTQKICGRTARGRKCPKCDPSLLSSARGMSNFLSTGSIRPAGPAGAGSVSAGPTSSAPPVPPPSNSLLSSSSLGVPTLNRLSSSNIKKRRIVISDEVESKKVSRSLTITSPSSNRKKLDKIDEEEEDQRNYVDYAMQRLLSQYQNAANHGDRFEILAPALAGDYLILQLESYQNDRAQNPHAHENLVFIPVNIGDYHWVGLLLIYENDGFDHAVHFDPLGGGMDPDIQDSLNSIYSIVFGVDVPIIDLKTRYQNDGYNCGPWVIEWFHALANANVDGYVDDYDDILPTHVGDRINVFRRRQLARPGLPGIMNAYYDSSSASVHNPLIPFSISSSSSSSDLTDLTKENFSCSQKIIIKENERIYLQNRDGTTQDLFEWAHQYQIYLERLCEKSKLHQGYNEAIKRLILIQTKELDKKQIKKLLDEIAFILSTDDLWSFPERQLMPLTPIRITIPAGRENDEDYMREFELQLQTQLDGLNEYSLEQIFLRIDLYDLNDKNRQDDVFNGLASINDLDQASYRRALLNKLRRRIIRLRNSARDHVRDIRSSKLDLAQRQIESLLDQNTISKEQLEDILQNCEDALGRLDDYYQPKWAHSDNVNSIRQPLMGRTTGRTHPDFDHIHNIDDTSTNSAGLAALHNPDQSMGGKRRFPNLNQRELEDNQRFFFGSGKVNSDIGSIWRGGSKLETAGHGVIKETPQAKMRELRFKIHPYRWSNLLGNFQFVLQSGDGTPYKTLSPTSEFNRPRNRKDFSKKYSQPSIEVQPTLMNFFSSTARSISNSIFGSSSIMPSMPVCKICGENTVLNLGETCLACLSKKNK